MVSDTGNGIERAAVSRTARIELVGQASLIVGFVALAATLFEQTREMAWIPALPAILLAIAALNIGDCRKRYATAGLMLGWFAFAYSFALMLWG